MRSVIIHLISFICVNYKAGLFKKHSLVDFFTIAVSHDCVAIGETIFVISFSVSVKFVNYCNLLHNFIGCLIICRRSHIMCSFYKYYNKTLLVKK
jgi:hypothetical protein